MNQQKKIFSVLLLAMLFPVYAWALSDQEEINHILKMGKPPFGVVFEIVEGSPKALDWAIPKVKKFAEQLKKKFPDIGIAVVSHGKEQFALLTAMEKDNQTVHAQVKSLVQDDKIPVHICGTHASWYGKKEKDFPEFVDVTPAGPTQLANYEDMGYEKIVLDPE